MTMSSTIGALPAIRILHIPNRTFEKVPEKVERHQQTPWDAEKQTEKRGETPEQHRESSNGASLAFRNEQKIMIEKMRPRTQSEERATRCRRSKFSE